VIRPGGLLTGLSSDTPPLLRRDDVVAVAFDRLFQGYTHSEQRDQSAIVALLDPPDEERGHGDVVAAFREITRDMPEGTQDAVLVGEPVLLSEGFDLIERDGGQLAVWTIALLSPLVLLLLRSWRWVLLQAIVIGWSVTVTRALLYALGIRLSLVSSILTAICTVIAVTAVIHLGTAWRKRRARGDDAYASAIGGMSLVLPPIFWACATDAAGFISLLASAIAPIRDFGLMMAIASMAVCVSMVLAAPLVMTLGVSGWRFLPSLQRVLDRLQRTIRRAAVRLAAAMIRVRYVVLLLAAALAGLTVEGINRLQIETSFLQNFRDDSEIAASYVRVEQALKGAGVWDIILDAPDALTDGYMARVRDLENRLRDIRVGDEKLTKVLSMADADRIATAIPLLRIASPSVRLNGMRAAIPAFSDALLVPDDQPHRKLRIMLRSREHLPAEIKMELIAKVEQVVREETTSDAWKSVFTSDEQTDAAEATGPGRVTGYYVMIARLVSQILGDQWRCLALAAAMVWVLLIFATRSLVLATLALVPNLLPVLGVLGLLGWYGEPMNMGAAMIAAVSVGLSIDGSVHYLAAFRRKRARCRSANESAIFAQRGVGLPVILATLALVVGFMGLGRSEFVPTATFGVLTAVALLAGTAANLVLMPILVSFTGARDRGTPQPAR
jgi:predicted RND superfamily exporter protein